MSDSKPPVAALLSVAFAAVVGAAAWVFFDRAADAGVARLARLDAVRAVCDERYAAARSRDDTMRVDRSALPDTIDPQSSDRIDRCGVLRAQQPVTPNPREMSGEEMPRGLR